ncbi:MAG: ankyrin repeat domain-containing protein [Alphaproteobacteria bacterium]|nr:ankyrin repeat domain-containing protein [Alphaproteobacteria bacterium]
MYIQRPRFFITFIIAIIVGLAMILLAFVNTHQTSATEETAEQQFERIFDEELAKATEREAVTKKTLNNAELRLFCYYVILKNLDFRDILTENDVQAIIDELTQFQPTEFDKLVHHQAEMLVYANDITREIRTSRTEEHGYLEYYYLTYQASDGRKAYKFSFSPTIDEILLRAATEHPEMDINYDPDYVANPLFMQLAYTTNNNIIPLIQFFLDNGVDINMQNPKFGNTIFSSIGTLEIAQFLLKNGADPTIVTKSNGNPLRYAISFERSNELIRLLIDSGVDLNIRSTFDGENALDTAKDKVKGLEYDIWRMENSSDSSPGDEFLHARIEKAEEVVRIIEQALEAEKK